MNTFNYITILVLVLVTSCKKPFSEAPKMALALTNETPKKSTSVVFIAGFDEGTNTYYTNAKKHFQNQDILLVENLFSINDIIQWLNKNANTQNTYNEIHIVSHSNPWLGMSLKTSESGKRITLKSLQNAKQTHEITPLKNGITNTTKIIFHSCGLGENTALLKELKHSFSTTETPKVYASTFFNVFGGKYANHYLAKPYYGFYPTAESPGPLQLSKEFKNTYPNTPINWFTALKTRQETNIGSVYSYKFNIPVDWEFTFNDTLQIPKLKNRNNIMDWVVESPEMAEILYNLNIPIEKYRWRSKVQGNKLIIKGKTTVLCVLEPILNIDDTNEYRNTSVQDSTLYKMI